MKENDFTWKWKVGSDRILTEAYECIGKQLLDEKSQFPAVARASIMAGQIRRNHWLRMNEIHHHIFLKFLEQNRHITFDAEKASLYTYAGHHSYLEARGLKRKHEKIKSNETTFLYCVLDDNLNPHWYSDILPKSVKKDTWKPLLKSQSPLLDRLTESESPEDILIKKEFWGLVCAHYDEVDIMVLLGRMKKTEAASELQINYDAYCKRLHRKNLSFRIIATKAGHC
jgi:hypothetical protein